MFAVGAAFHNAYGPDKPWCWDAAIAGGGALVDLGVHLIDLALWLLSGPDGAGGHPAIAAVSGAPLREGRPLAGRGIDDFTTAPLSLRRNGEPPVSLHLATSWNAHAGRDCDFRFDLHGTLASASFHNEGGSFYDFALALRHGRDEQLLTRESADWLGRATVAWTHSLATSPAYDPAIETSLQVAQAVDAIYRSSD